MLLDCIASSQLFSETQVLRSVKPSHSNLIRKTINLLLNLWYRVATTQHQIKGCGVQLFGYSVGHHEQSPHSCHSITELQRHILPAPTHSHNGKIFRSSYWKINHIPTRQHFHFCSDSCWEGGTDSQSGFEEKLSFELSFVSGLILLLWVGY